MKKAVITGIGAVSPYSEARKSAGVSPSPWAAQMVSIAAGMGLPAWAEAAWPSRSVRLVVPFPAGGNVDVFSRVLFRQVESEIGTTFVIDNRGGANGIIGAETMIRSPADGYTLMMTTASVTSINMVTYGKPPYDTLRDMLPLSPVMMKNWLPLVFGPELAIATEPMRYGSILSSSSANS